MKLASSTDGIIEYEATHFGSQMRGNLVLAKYGGSLYRVILSPDGRSVIPASDPAINLGGQDSLSIAQAPDGTIISANYNQNNLFYYAPIEPATSQMSIKSVFPRRGALAGGSTLHIYGVNFATGTPTVTVGGKQCTGAVRKSATKISCTLPLGTKGAVDVTVTTGTSTSTMPKGYRYILGKPENPRC